MSDSVKSVGLAELLPARALNDHGQCVQCGYCCTVRACFHGEWDESLGRCRFVVDCDDGGKSCSRHDEIAEAEADSGLPMFGCGCSSTMFNRVREARLAAMNAVQRL